MKIFVMTECCTVYKNTVYVFSRSVYCEAAGFLCVGWRVVSKNRLKPTNENYREEKVKDYEIRTQLFKKR